VRECDEGKERGKIGKKSMVKLKFDENSQVRVW
jgi:hypothetical protein